MKGAFTGLVVAILSLVFFLSAADSGSTKTTTSVVTAATSTQSDGGGSNLNSNLQRNLHFGGHGKNYQP